MHLRATALISLLVILILTGPASGQTQLLFEDFGTSFAPGPPTGWSGNFAVTPCDATTGIDLLLAPSEGSFAWFYPFDPAGTAESPTFDASQPGTIRLQFDHDHAPDDSTVSVEVFDGANWNQVYSNTAGTGGQVRTTLFISGATGGSTSARLRFTRALGQAATFNFNTWAIDNVSVDNIAGAQVDSIDRAAAAPPVTTAAAVDFDVHFREPVRDVDAADFVVDTSLGGASVNSVTSELGQAVSLTSTDDRIVRPSLQLPSGSAPAGELGYGFELWMKYGGANSSGALLSYATAASDNEILIDDVNDLDVWIDDAPILSSLADLTDGAWHHIAVSVREEFCLLNGVVTVFLDGDVLAEVILPTLPLLDQGGTLILGEEQDSLGGGFSTGQAFIGCYDEVRIWSKPLTTADVRANMFRTLTGNEPNLTLHWDMDAFENLGANGGGADDVRDSSPNAQHGDTENGLALASPPPFAERYLVTVDTGSGPVTGPIGLDFINDFTVFGRLGPSPQSFTTGEEYVYCGGGPLFPTVNVPGDFATIQAAIDSSCDGTRIEVGPGTWTENVDFLGRDLELVATGAVETTVIDAGGNGRAVDMLGCPATARLEGFTLTGGSSGAGAGLRISSGDVVRCVFDGNSSSTSGGGVYVPDNGAVRFANCVFTGNACSLSGGAVRADNFSSIDVDGCTFHGNSAGVSGGAISASGTANLRSSIVWGGHAPDNLDGSGAGGTVSNSCIEGSLDDFSDAGQNIFVDPNFHDELGGDFHLRPGSPCIDTGPIIYVPSLINYGNADLDDRQRIFAGNVDMGAYEIDRALPGTTEDLVLETLVNGGGHPLAWQRKICAGGDTLIIRIDSPGGFYHGFPPQIFGQVIPIGSPFMPIFPGINLDLSLSAPFVMFDGTSAFPPFGSSLLLPPGGFTFQGSMPMAFTGMDVLCQGFIITSVSTNGIFASTDTMVFEVQ